MYLHVGDRRSEEEKGHSDGLIYVDRSRTAVGDEHAPNAVVFHTKALDYYSSGHVSCTWKDRMARSVLALVH